MVEVNVGLLLISLFTAIVVIIILIATMGREGVKISVDIIEILLLVWVILILIPISDFVVAFTQLLGAVG